MHPVTKDDLFLQCIQASQSFLSKGCPHVRENLSRGIESMELGLYI